MKKYLFLGFVALTALTVTSCSNDEVVEAMPQKKAIEFSTYLGRDAQGRGAIMDDDALKTVGAGFGVLAYYTGETSWDEATDRTPNFMYNQQVTWNTSDWEYSPKKYWPTNRGDKITFFAYAPMASQDNGITISEKTAQTPQVTYTIDPENLENMGDFVADALISQTRSNTELSLDDNDNPVAFTLNHELTRVNIQAKLSAVAFDADAANKTKVNITDIQFTGTGFATTGTYTFANKNDVAAVGGEPAVTNRGTWSYYSVANPVSIFDITNDATSGTFVNWVVDSELAPYEVKGVSVPSTAVIDLFVDNHYLFLIPTNGTTGIESGKEVSMRVAYDIVTVDDKLDDGFSKTSAVKEIVLPSGLLKQGVAYNILLTFGMNEITLSATVADDWGTVNNDGNANVDYPKEDI